MNERDSQNLVMFAQSQIGDSHKRRGICCEDAAGKLVVLSDEMWCGQVFAVADGHGDPACALSAVGSQKAVDIALKLLVSICKHLERHEKVVERLASYHDVKDNLQLRDELLASLAGAIVSKWREEIASDYAKRQLTDEQKAAIRRHGEDWAKRVEHIYGTTLLAGLVTPRLVLLLQQGDGCCAAIGRDKGEPHWRPIPDDPRCVGNVTSSMSDEDAQESMRFAVIDREKNDPVAVLVGTDGVDKSMADGGDSYFLRRVTLMALDICDEGYQDVSGMLDAKLVPELFRLSQLGAGDDTSAAGYINIDLALASRQNIEEDMESFRAGNELTKVESRFTSMQRRAAHIRQKRDAGQELSEAEGKYLEEYGQIRDRLQELGGDPDAIERASSAPAPTLAQLNAMAEAPVPVDGGQDPAPTQARHVTAVPPRQDQGRLEQRGMAQVQAPQRPTTAPQGAQVAPMPQAPAPTQAPGDAPFREDGFRAGDERSTRAPRRGEGDVRVEPGGGGSRLPLILGAVAIALLAAFAVVRLTGILGRKPSDESAKQDKKGEQTAPVSTEGDADEDADGLVSWGSGPYAEVIRAYQVTTGEVQVKSGTEAEAQGDAQSQAEPESKAQPETVASDAVMEEVESRWEKAQADIGGNERAYWSTYDLDGDGVQELVIMRGAQEDESGTAGRRYKHVIDIWAYDEGQGPSQLTFEDSNGGEGSTWNGLYILASGELAQRWTYDGQGASEEYLTKLYQVVEGNAYLDETHESFAYRQGRFLLDDMPVDELDYEDAIVEAGLLKESGTPREDASLTPQDLSDYGLQSGQTGQVQGSNGASGEGTESSAQGSDAGGVIDTQDADDEEIDDTDEGSHSVGDETYSDGTGEGENGVSGTVTEGESSNGAGGTTQEGERLGYSRPVWRGEEGPQGRSRAWSASR